MKDSLFNEYLNVNDDDWCICLEKSFSFLRHSWSNQWVGLPSLLSRCVDFLGLSASPLTVDASQMLLTARAVALSIEYQYCLGSIKLEPRYHNRLHTADVLTAMSVLIAIQSKIQNNLDKEWVACALLSAIGHDFDHSGNVNQFESEIELKTIQKLEPLISSHVLPSKWRNALEGAILKSDFALVQKNHELVKGKEFKCDQDWLNVYLNEADVIASATAKFGLELGNSLSDEWRLIDLPAYQSVSTDAGRKVFLKQLKFSSGASRLLEINANIAAELLTQDK